MHLSPTKLDRAKANKHPIRIHNKNHFSCNIKKHVFHSPYLLTVSIVLTVAHQSFPPTLHPPRRLSFRWLALIVTRQIKYLYATPKTALFCTGALVVSPNDSVSDMPQATCSLCAIGLGQRPHKVQLLALLIRIDRCSLVVID